MNIWVTTIVFYSKVVAITLLILALINLIMEKVKIKGETLWEIISKTKLRRYAVYLTLVTVIIAAAIINISNIDYMLGLLFVIVFVITTIIIEKIFRNKEPL